MSQILFSPFLIKNQVGLQGTHERLSNIYGCDIRIL
jgi:hypothetical protein